MPFIIRKIAQLAYKTSSHGGPKNEFTDSNYKQIQ